MKKSIIVAICLVITLSFVVNQEGVCEERYAEYLMNNLPDQGSSKEDREHCARFFYALYVHDWYGGPLYLRSVETLDWMINQQGLIEPEDIGMSQEEFDAIIRGVEINATKNFFYRFYADPLEADDAFAVSLLKRRDLSLEDLSLPPRVLKFLQERDFNSRLNEQQ